MAAPCPTVEVRNQRLCVTFPGSSQVCAQVPTPGGPSPLTLAKQLMAQSSAALAPVRPILNLVGMALAVRDFASAVPGLLSDPGAVARAARDVAKKSAELAALVPQLSVPLMIAGLIDLNIAYVDGAVEALGSLSAQQSRIDAAVALAQQQGLDALVDAALCASEQLAAQLANVQAGAGPVDDLNAAVNAVAKLVPGLPQLPEFGALPPSVDESVAALGLVRDALVIARGAIPV